MSMVNTRCRIWCRIRAEIILRRNTLNEKPTWRCRRLNEGFRGASSLAWVNTRVENISFGVFSRVLFSRPFFFLILFSLNSFYHVNNWVVRITIVVSCFSYFSFRFVKSRYAGVSVGSRRVAVYLVPGTECGGQTILFVSPIVAFDVISSLLEAMGVFATSWNLRLGGNARRFCF